MNLITRAFFGLVLLGILISASGFAAEVGDSPDQSVLANFKQDEVSEDTTKNDSGSIEDEEEEEDKDAKTEDDEDSTSTEKDDETEEEINSSSGEIPDGFIPDGPEDAPDGDDDATIIDPLDDSTSESLEEESELIQLFTYSRYGASTDNQFFYDDEWLPYNLNSSNETMESLLTPLGQAQCWSVGSNIAQKYADFVQDSLDKDSYTLNTVMEKKNRMCLDQIWFGMTEYTPFIGLFEDDTVKETINDKGNCYNCTDSTKFPFGESQDMEPVSNANYECPNVVVQPEEFLDLSVKCVSRRRFNDFYIDPILEEDIEIFKSISPFFEISETFIPYVAMQMLFKHVYHNLPLMHGLQDLSTPTITRASVMKDGITEDYIKNFLDVDATAWTLPAIYGRSLILDLIANLRSQESALNVYAAHSNNIISLLIFLIGVESSLEVYMPYFTSTIELRVFQDAESSIKRVEVIYDNKPMPVKGCGFRCELNDFIDILDTYEFLGGDLKDFCDDGADTETETPETPEAPETPETPEAPEEPTRTEEEETTTEESRTIESISI